MFYENITYEEAVFLLKQAQYAEHKAWWSLQAKKNALQDATLLVQRLCEHKSTALTFRAECTEIRCVNCSKIMGNLE